MLTITISRGTTLPSDRPITIADLNLLGLPTVAIAGSVGASDIGAGSVNYTHVTPGGICVGTATGTTTLTVTLIPGPTSHASGTWLWFVPASTNTGNVTLTINTLGPKSLRRMDGSEVRPGDLAAGKPALVTYDSTGGYYLLLNPAGPVGLYAVDSGTANAASVTIPWTFNALADLTGVPIAIKKIASANTGATTLDVNAKGATAIRTATGAAMAAGQLPANGLFEVVYDGTYFRLTSGGTKAIFGGALTAGSTVTVDLNAGEFFTLDTGTEDGTETIAFSGTPVTGQALVIAVTYGSGTTPTIAGPTGTLWAGGTAPSAGASGQKDLIAFQYDGTAWWGLFRTDFAT